VRVKEGEINFWDIVTERQDVRSTTGVPGLSQIPWVAGCSKMRTSPSAKR
jgi:hypothetical protein